MKFSNKIKIIAVAATLLGGVAVAAVGTSINQPISPADTSTNTAQTTQDTGTPDPTTTSPTPDDPTLGTTVTTDPSTTPAPAPAPKPAPKPRVCVANCVAATPPASVSHFCDNAAGDHTFLWQNCTSTPQAGLTYCRSMDSADLWVTNCAAPVYQDPAQTTTTQVDPTVPVDTTPEPGNGSSQ